MFKKLFNKRTLIYELLHPLYFTIERVESVYNVPEIIAYLGPEIWNIVPSEL